MSEPGTVALTIGHDGAVFGEFMAQDAGSPAIVRLNGTSATIDAWRPSDASEWVRYDIREGPLDTEIEAEPLQVDERLRAEGGIHLLRMLDDAGLPEAATGVPPTRAGPVVQRIVARLDPSREGTGHRREFQRTRLRHGAAY